jgi:uncharacterized protein YfkK (UPF0435 family)
MKLKTINEIKQSYLINNEWWEHLLINEENTAVTDNDKLLVQQYGKKAPYVFKQLEPKYSDKTQEQLEYIYDIVFITPKMKKKKQSPYIDTVLKWVLNGSIRLPEDKEKTIESITEFNRQKQEGVLKGEEGDIDRYESDSDLYKVISKDKGLGTSGGYEKYGAKLVIRQDPYKVYQVDDYKTGKKLFSNSGWCVAHEHHFDKYGPPYYLVTKHDTDGEERLALVHYMSLQLKNIDNEPFDSEPDFYPLIKDGYYKAIPKITNEKDLDFNMSWDADLRKLGVMHNIFTIPKDNTFSYDELKQFAGGAYYLIESNKYKNEDEEELLNIIMKNPKYAYKYASVFIKDRWPEAEPYIMKNAEYANLYATYIIEKRWPEAEPYIMKDPDEACTYASDLIKGRWPEAEPYIMKNPESAYTYTSDLIKGRWLEAEPHIMKDPEYAASYAAEIIEGRWPEAEPIIMKNAFAAYHYSKDIKGRWPEAEPYIMKDPDAASRYAESVIGRRWPEAEPIIMKDSGAALSYVFGVINKDDTTNKKRWPEAEPYIMKNPLYIMMYADGIIGGRWLEAEPYLKKNKYAEQQYMRKFNIGQY